ncbi:hypothetical protein CC80DRAFT_501762 [Byssothecium circinans]|uniref:Uncharacterized protein n=1 Tax=Byssothecium circinans TaxID=147558 RepID=A0A6A5U9L8_9PLEO|nr:hypothetical protein CC80DRAFT_501762 [Byssothecium circinans]
MHHHLTLLLTLLAPSTTHAINTLRFHNHCPHALYFWAVPPDAEEADWKHTIVPPNGGMAHHTIPASAANVSGTSVKIRDLPHYVHAPAGILQAEYNLDLAAGKTWYDLSLVDCNSRVGPDYPMYCPFLQGGIKMYVEGNQGKGSVAEGCMVAECVTGEDCTNTYLVAGSWKDEPSGSCEAGRDVVLEVCSVTRDVERSAWKDGDDEVVEYGV